MVFLSFSGPDSHPPSPFSPALIKTRSTSSPPALRSAPSSSRDPCFSTPAPSRRMRKRRPAPADHAPSLNTITCPLRSPPARAQMTPRKRWPSLPPNSRRRPRNRLPSLRTLKSAKRAQSWSPSRPRHTRFAHPKLPLLSLMDPTFVLNLYYLHGIATVARTRSANVNAAEGFEYVAMPRFRVWTGMASEELDGRMRFGKRTLEYANQKFKWLHCYLDKWVRVSYRNLIY